VRVNVYVLKNETFHLKVLSSTLNSINKNNSMMFNLVKQWNMFFLDLYRVKANKHQIAYLCE